MLVKPSLRQMPCHTDITWWGISTIRAAQRCRTHQTGQHTHCTVHSSDSSSCNHRHGTSITRTLKTIIGHKWTFLTLKMANHSTTECGRPTLHQIHVSTIAFVVLRGENPFIIFVHFTLSRHHDHKVDASFPSQFHHQSSAQAPCRHTSIKQKLINKPCLKIVWKVKVILEEIHKGKAFKSLNTIKLDIVVELTYRGKHGLSHLSWTHTKYWRISMKQFN